MTLKIVLNSDTFLYHEGEKGLLYNCKESTVCVFDARNKIIRHAIEQWNDLRNLYTAKVEFSNNDVEIVSFLSQIKDKKLGVVVPEEEETPLSFPPVLRIKNSIDNLPSWYQGSTGSLPVLQYLNRLIVCLGGDSGQGNTWRQAVYPVPSNNKLNIDSFLSFVSRIDKSALSSITLVISEWDNAQIMDCANGLTKFKSNTRFCFFAPDPSFNNVILEKLVAEGYAIMQECPPEAICGKDFWVHGRRYRFLVRSEEDVEQWEARLQEAEGVDYDFLPVADNNLDFFRKNIFLSEEEILSQKLTKQDIFRHQALNVNQFGVFFVFPDGTIHPAADAPAIGTLSDTVHRTIVRELEENHAWRQTRRQMEPCKGCLYKDLCPSPSVYERALGVPGCTCWR